jgi:CHAT domain-containing protein
VSHWVVKSDAAVMLTTNTFAQLEQDLGAGRAEAFRRAEMAMLDSTTLPPRYAQPMYWAPFILVGDNGDGSRAIARGN